MHSVMKIVFPLFYFLLLTGASMARASRTALHLPEDLPPTGRAGKAF